MHFSVNQTCFALLRSQITSFHLFRLSQLQPLLRSHDIQEPITEHLLVTGTTFSDGEIRSGSGQIRSNPVRFRSGSEFPIRSNPGCVMCNEYGEALFYKTYMTTANKEMTLVVNVAVIVNISRPLIGLHRTA